MKRRNTIIKIQALEDTQLLYDTISVMLTAGYISKIDTLSLACTCTSLSTVQPNDPLELAKISLANNNETAATYFLSILRNSQNLDIRPEQLRISSGLDLKRKKSHARTNIDHSKNLPVRVIIF